MKKRVSKSGMTLVEVMVAVFLVAIAAAIIYTEMLVSYRILMRSRAKLEALSLAFDTIWDTYNWPMESFPRYSEVDPQPTPEGCLLGTNGTIKLVIRPATEGLAPELMPYWDILVEVWPEQDSPLQVGTNSLATYSIRRYRGDR